MNSEQKDAYLAWLRDAHAMELALVVMLEKQVKDTEGKPDLQSRISKHLEETRMHAEKVEACIKRIGGDVSTAKDLSAKMTSALNGLGMSIMGDQMVKEIHSAYAAEHFEIASYTVIRSAAQALGDPEGADMCDDILSEEYAMADWVKEQVPLVVAEYVRSLGA